MLNFWLHQDISRQRSMKLFCCYILVILVLIFTIYIVLKGILVPLSHLSSSKNEITYFILMSIVCFWKSKLFWFITFVICLPVICGTVFRERMLRWQGGKVVAEMLWGRLLEFNTRDFYEYRLLNIVEEMSIASGVPAPQVYILEHRTAINALVAGLTRHDAVICVTRGAMELLDRDELQGVVAHEFAHLLNGDMTFNTRMHGLLHGFHAMVMYAHKSFGNLDAQSCGGLLDQSTDSITKGSYAIFGVLGLGLWAFGQTFHLIGMLFKLAFAREREFLADAFAVQFTRYAKGIGGALKKVGVMRSHQVMHFAPIPEVNYFFFVDAQTQALFDCLASHPPLEERVRRIDPAFDGKYPSFNYHGVRRDIQKKRRLLWDRPTELQDDISGIPPVLLVIDEAEKKVCKLTRSGRFQAIESQVGSPNADAFAYAKKVLTGIPREALDLIHSIDGAVSVAYLLLLEQDPDLRNSQLELIRKNYGPAIDELLTGLVDASGNIKLVNKIHLAELCLPVLRNIAEDEYERFRKLIRKIVLMDKTMTLLEYALVTFFITELDISHELTPPPQAKIKKLSQVTAECSVLLSVMAWAGAKDETAAQAAFAAGRNQGEKEMANLSMRQAAELTPQEMDAAVGKLRMLYPQQQRLLINACLTAVGADDHIGGDEWDVFRAFAMMLDCPIPPLPPGK